MKKYDHILEKQTTVEHFADALHVTLKQMLSEKLAPDALQIKQAVLKDSRGEQVTPLIALAEKTLQSLLKSVGVTVKPKANLSVSSFPAEKRRYELSSPKLNPAVHLKAEKKRQERLEEEKQYEMKKALDPQLQREMSSVLTMKPLGV